MKKFLFGASAFVLLSSAAMAEPAQLSDGQLGAVEAGDAAWSLIANNIVTNTLANTVTNTTVTTVNNTIGQGLTGGSANNVYNVALTSPGAIAQGTATTSLIGTIMRAP